MNIQTSYDPTVPLLEHNRNAQVYLSKDGFKTLQSSKFILKRDLVGDPHFKNEDAGAQRYQVTCSRPTS